MSSNLKRLAAVAAVSAAGALAPVASASAATPTRLPAFTFPSYDLTSLAAWARALAGFTPAGIATANPPAGSIIGPTVITTGNGQVFTGTTVTTTTPAATPSGP